MSTVTKQSSSLYKLVMAHYLVSALCFLIMAVMLLFSVHELTGHYFHPKLLAITHMAALGWGTFVIFGACYQLIPVVFATDLYSLRLPWISFYLFITGLALLVFSFWVFDPGLTMQVGGVLLLLSISTFSLVVFLTGRRVGKNPTIQQEFIVTSCIWLVGTAILGALLVFNFRYPFLPKDHLQFLRLHAHMGIAGWLLLLIIGVSAKLIPMFLVSRQQKEIWLSWSFYLINVALIAFLIDTYIYGINVKTLFIAAAMALGVVMYFVYIYICFRSRIKIHLDLPITNTIVSLGLLASAVFTAPLVVYFNGASGLLSLRLTILYGSLIFIGWISSLILGQAFKTLPFIVWTKRYEHLAGKTKIPLPADLYSMQTLRTQTVAFILFCFCFYAGLLFNSTQLLYSGVIFLIITALLYTANLFYLLLHRSINNHDTLRHH